MLVKAAAVKTQARRVLSRPKTVLPAVLVLFVLCLLGLLRHNGQLNQSPAFLESNHFLERVPGR